MRYDELIKTVSEIINNEDPIKYMIEKIKLLIIMSGY